MRKEAHVVKFKFVHIEQPGSMVEG